MKINRIEPLTFLRFVAALIVVIYHYGSTTTLAQMAGSAITSGLQMVTFFFVLSGFVLMLAYYPSQQSFKQFYVSRLARIAPAYVVAFVIACFLEYSRRGAHNNLAPFLHVTFLQSWFPGYPMLLNAPAWSLSAEVFFYLTFPLLLFIIKATRVKFQTLLTMAGILWAFTQVLVTYLLNSKFYMGPHSLSHEFLLYFPLNHYCSFLFGVAGGYAFLQTHEKYTVSARKGLVLVAVAFALVYLALQYPNVYLGHWGFSIPVSVGLYAPMFLVLILCISWTQNWLTKILSWPILVLLGNISYAVYIFQAPIHWLYLKYIQRRLSLGVDGDFYVFLLLLLLCSIVSFYLIETPARKLILKFAARFEDRRAKTSFDGSTAQPSQG